MRRERIAAVFENRMVHFFAQSQDTTFDKKFTVLSNLNRVALVRGLRLRMVYYVCASQCVSVADKISVPL